MNYFNLTDIPDTEREIKFYLPESEILALASKIPVQPTIIRSVALLDGNRRRESFYNERCAKTHHEDVFKKIVAEEKKKSMRLTIATETPITDFDPKKCTIIRLKYRTRFEREYYYLDITRVKKISPQTPKISTAICEFFEAPAGDLEMEAELKPTTPFSKLTEILNELGHQPSPLQDLAKKLSKRGDTVKQLTNNPKMFSTEIFEKSFRASDFLVMEKSDGKRCLLQIFDKSFNEILEGSVRSIGQIPVAENYHLVDCEMIDDEYFAFDIILEYGVPIRGNYKTRLEALRKHAGIYAVKDIREVTCENLIQLSRGPKCDGLIFQEIQGDYYTARILKWKPAEMMTFDFLIVPMPFTGVKPFISQHNLYLLMVGAKKGSVQVPGIYLKLMAHHNLPVGNYAPVPFSPPLAPLTYIWESPEKYSLCVGEFIFNNGWRLVKIREDKTLLISRGIYGNDFRVAEEQFNEINNPLTLQKLCLKLGGSETVPYFQQQKDVEYARMAKFNNFVKFRVMSMLQGVNRVLDIASGRGSDVFIYNGLNVGHVSFVEPDKVAFIELSKRVKLLHENKFYTHTPKPKKNMTFDLTNADYETFSKTVSKYTALVCNFAAHYFLRSYTDYKNFNSFCAANSIEIIILTILDSEIVDKHLVNGVYKNERYYIEAHDAPSGSEGKNANRQGEYHIKHHFSSVLIPEAKINTPKLIRAMKHYEVIKRDSFGSYLEEYERCKKIELPPIDKEYSSFYQYLVFRKS